MKHTLLRRLSPERLFILSFIALILTGAVLLRMPAAASNQPLSFLDAVFTSASAVCVTGLAVIGVGQDLSAYGQGVTLALFQLGGLGIITYSAMFFVMIGRGLATRERDILQSVFLGEPRRDITAILKFVLVSTACFEAAGTLLLWVRFCRDLSPGQALFRAVYHSVSAFNNCGYALFPDSLMSFQGDLLVNATVMTLIVAGGIGFIVHFELVMRLRGRQRHLSVHTKIVLIATAALIVSGALLFFAFEHKGILKGLPFQSQVLASLFQSITARTAGFNTVEIAQLGNPTLLMILLMMFIGASPGSTAGGENHQCGPALPAVVEPRQGPGRGNRIQPHHSPGIAEPNGFHPSGIYPVHRFDHVGGPGRGRRYPPAGSKSSSVR